MKGGSLVLGYGSSSCSKFQFSLHNHHPSISLRQTFPSSTNFASRIIRINSKGWHSENPNPRQKNRIRVRVRATSNRNSTLAVNLKETETTSSLSASDEDDYRDALPRIDKSGKFCSPRAARELALLIVYASCLEGIDPVRLFEKRLNAPRELDYEFEKSSLLQYNHMSFAGPPVATATIDEADRLLSQYEAESATEAEVLSAPLKLVYSNLLLRFTKKLLGAVVDRWDNHVLVIEKVAPLNWKIEPAGKILEFSILHLAMSEISVLGTRHQIVINEAVDLAKRFCDGAAPRIINGCLRTFVQDLL